MRRCIEDEELFALVDGAVAEKDATPMRAHIQGCARCAESLRTMEHSLARMAEPPTIDLRAHVDAVLAAVDEREREEAERMAASSSSSSSSSSRWPSRPVLRRTLAMAAGALAVAAVIALGIGKRGHLGDDRFTARGGTSPGKTPLERSIAVTLYELDVHGQIANPLHAGARVVRNARFVASHRNTGTTPAHALVFAVDASSTVHWLYPAYESDASDPSSVPLPPTSGREVMMDTSVSFDDLEPGPLTIVTLLGRDAIRVSRIEGRIDISLDALRRDFPEAEVSTIAVNVSEK